MRRAPIPKRFESLVPLMKYIHNAPSIYGSRRMKDALYDDYAIAIGRHRARRLMRLMGLEAIYPKKKPQTSISEQSHKKYPYLLRGLPIIHPNQVWGTDITYLRLRGRALRILPILQPQTPAPVAKQSNAGRCLPKQSKVEPKINNFFAANSI